MPLILDTGICSLYAIENTAAAGNMPAIRPVLPAFSQPWYGELDFESNPVFETQMQENVEISARIRILQDRRVSRQTLVVLSDGKQYKVERAFHGRDKESGERITDLNLSRVVSAYDVAGV
jgi:hypothetical protein